MIERTDSRLRNSRPIGNVVIGSEQDHVFTVSRDRAKHEHLGCKPSDSTRRKVSDGNDLTPFQCTSLIVPRDLGARCLDPETAKVDLKLDGRFPGAGVSNSRNHRPHPYVEFLKSIERHHVRTYS